MIEISRQQQRASAHDFLKHENALLKAQLKARVEIEKAYRRTVETQVAQLTSYFNASIAKNEELKRTIKELKEKLKNG